MSSDARRVDLALAALSVLLTAEAVLLAPLQADAAFTLRQARAQAAGAVPCRDIYCEYTPLVPTLMAAAGGGPVASMAMVQLAILGCALLTYRLARTLGNPAAPARRIALLTWALVLANEGRAIEFEPFTLLCLLAAANSFCSSSGAGAALRSGLWIGAGFWTKQYALVAWAALLAEALWTRSSARAMALTAGTLLAVAAGFGWLAVLGTEPARFASLWGARAYPPAPLWSNLTTAPDLVLLLLLTYSTVTGAALRSDTPPVLRLPFLISVAALLPMGFRGYRHYWQLVIPFILMIVLAARQAPAGPSWTALARRAAIALITLSVGLDVGRCVRDVVTDARKLQRDEAEILTRLTGRGGAILYLIDPSVLGWIDAPIVAPREVGPKYTRLSKEEAAALLSSASVVVWDPVFPGADTALRRLDPDPAVALSDRGFRPVATSGRFRVYSRDN